MSLDHPSEAMSLLSGYRPEDVSRAAYHFIYAKALAERQKPLMAIEHLTKSYLYAPPGELRQLSFLLRAETYLKMGYFDEARTQFRVFERLFPESSYNLRAYRGLAVSLSETGSPAEAMLYYEKAGKGPEVLLEMANTSQRIGMTGQASGLYKEVYQKRPDLIQASDETRFLLGENRRLSGKLAEAQLYYASVRTNPFREKAELAQGLMELEGGKLESAADFFERVAHSADRHIARQALLHLAETRLRAGRAGDAKEALQAIRMNYPYCPEYDAALLQLGKIAVSEGHPETAVKLLNELVFRRNPSREALDQFESMIREAMGKGDTARLLGLWKSVGPWLLDTSRERFLLATAEALRHQWRPFFDLARWISKRGSADIQRRSCLMMAGAYADIGNTAAARIYLIKGRVGADPDEVRRTEAGIFIADGNKKAAAQALLGLRTIERADLPLLSEFITAAGSPGAVGRLDAAIRRLGAGADVCLRVADIYFEMNKRAEALSYYRRALEADPANEWALFMAGSLMTGSEADNMLTTAGKASSRVGTVASAYLKERTVDKKLREIF